MEGAQENRALRDAQRRGSRLPLTEGLRHVVTPRSHREGVRRRCRYEPIAGRNDFLKKNREAVRAFLADYVAALQWSVEPANREKVVDFMATMLKSPRQNLALFATSKDHWRDPQARVHVDRLQRPIDAMLKLGLIKEKLDIAPFIDLSYLPLR